MTDQEKVVMKIKNGIFGMLSGVFLLMAPALAQAATAGNLYISVTIGSTLSIAANQSSIGFGSFNLGDGLTLITTPIAVTNQTSSVVADLSLSAQNWGGDGSGEAAIVSAWINTNMAEGADAASLGAVFVSPGMRPLAATDVTNNSASDAVTGAAVEATGNTVGGCSSAGRYCIDEANYITTNIGGTDYYLGDGQNLTLGEQVSLRLFFRPPTLLTFESDSLSTTLSIVASSGGSEE